MAEIIELLENKYSKSKIYKIICNITREVYYGATIKTLKQRINKHKANCK